MNSNALTHKLAQIRLMLDNTQKNQNVIIKEAEKKEKRILHEITVVRDQLNNPEHFDNIFLRRKYRKLLDDLSRIQRLLTHHHNGSKKMNEKEEKFKKKTQEHIDKVKKNIYDLTDKLEKRALHHDESKFSDKELKPYSKTSSKLDSVKYGSPEYKQVISEMKPAVLHHYEENRHHPEHFKDGITGMTLVDLIEMICDWKTEIKSDDDFFKNVDRFKIDKQLATILKNTISEMPSE